jgi:serine/threonine protein phosphatase PrpC
MRKAVMARLRGLLGQLRFEIATLDVAKIREKRVKDLSRAINDISKLSKTAEPDERLRIYQLLGYLCMVLDGLLNNVTKGELLRRLTAVEERLDVGVEGARKTSETSGGQDKTSK